MSDMLLRLLEQTPIFKNAGGELLREAFLEYPPEIREYSRGDIIFDTGGSEKRLGLIVRGRASVTKGGSHKVIMSVSEKGDIFGAVTLFNPESGFVASITALCSVRTAFFDKAFAEYLIDKSPIISKNYIEYLSRRIYFLNSKIDSFTGVSAVSRLALWIYENADGSAAITLPCSVSSLSQRLNIGRASLYRAFEELEKEGVISRDGKNITVNDKNSLAEKI